MVSSIPQSLPSNDLNGLMDKKECCRKMTKTLLTTIIQQLSTIIKHTFGVGLLFTTLFSEYGCSVSIQVTALGEKLAAQL